MPNSDMLAFIYRIRKIIRDMNHLSLSEDDEAKRTAIVDALQELCRRIEGDFGGEPGAP